MPRHSSSPSFQIRPLGDQALVIDYGEQIDPVVNARVCAVASGIKALRWPGIVDVVPSFSAVAVHFRIEQIERSESGSPVAALCQRLARWLEASPPQAGEGIEPEIEIPVCFGGELGPDLVDAAAACGLAVDELVGLHLATARVYMLGFAPGAPYIGLYDERVSVPRRATPRIKVPAGSIGIANRQCVVYPVEAPGGWSLIGRTPLRFFDVDRDAPTLLRPGDRVRLTAISAEQWHSWPKR